MLALGHNPLGTAAELVSDDVSAAATHTCEVARVLSLSSTAPERCCSLLLAKHRVQGLQVAQQPRLLPVGNLFGIPCTRDTDKQRYSPIAPSALTP